MTNQCECTHRSVGCVLLNSMYRNYLRLQMFLMKIGNNLFHHNNENKIMSIIFDL